MITLKHIFDKQIKNVWIYGSGKLGVKVLQKLAIQGIEVQGFVVSSHDGKIIPNIPILELQNITTESDDTVFILTTPKSAYDEVSKTIKSYGYENIIIWDEKCEIKVWKNYKFRFTDRKRNNNKCLFVLAGYKDFLWEAVFSRIIEYVPEDVDVCIMSSGLYSEKLEKICEKQEWSYLSTYQNSVTLVQNIAFSLYEGYDWVYKIDEDIFVTENSFEKLYNCYIEMELKSKYKVGVVAPLIPINGYGHNVLFEKYNLVNDYEECFGRISLGGNPDNQLEKNPDAAIFCWDRLPKVDIMNKDFENTNTYNICGVRFSIGFILMKHSLWNQMNAFRVSGNADMGFDEEELCEYCINNSRAIIVAENTVVGHFSFGKQTEVMKQYYIDNIDKFNI